MKLRLDITKIHMAMAEKGLKQRDIADIGGISQQSVSKALTGQRIGRTKVLPAICKALDLQAKDILIIED